MRKLLLWRWSSGQLLFSENQRDPCLYIAIPLRAACYQLERRRHDADDLIRNVTQADISAENARVSREHPDPQTVTKNDNPPVTRLRLFFPERPPETRAHSQGPEVGGSHRKAKNPFGRVVRADVEATVLDQREFLEDVGRLLPVGVVGRGSRCFRDVSPRIHVVDRHQPFRFGVGKRP